ncbi:dynein regulatory complex subunit 7 [Takifugu flavidus]|uniref:dynein regulatory complex subunit 7 n=1 Tax=Takifugu flavidus TaxID=433684 RepID=UPI002544A1E1|nr:dynein regulatory complex subunit 7 [Takifugu flavidus]
MCVDHIYIYDGKMEPWAESQSEKPRGESELQEEQRLQQEGPRRISDLLQKLLSEGTTASYNSSSEARMVEIAENFQRQYSHLFPERRPLLMCPENENGIKKFVSTTLRPTAVEHPELYHWKGCASVVADLLSLKPLESPVNLPRQLFAPSTVLQSQSATCFEAATLLCSLLIGADYEAYCVSGYASREMCECDQTEQECPPMDTGEKDMMQEPQQNKYRLKPKKKLQSRYLVQQEMKKKNKESAQKGEEPPVDTLRGLRVHCWVLVFSGSRDIEENFFIDPLSGNSHSTDDEHFLGIESMWDNYNYYVNMQECCKDCSEVKYDLEDLKRWEPVLAGVTCKKKLKDKVLKRKEIRFLGKLNSEQEVELGPKAFQMPKPWSSCISISKKNLEHRYPGGKKVTFYRKAKLERFGLYLQSDGLLTRLTTYKDLSCTEVELVKEWYQGRTDFLDHREFNKILHVTTEHFLPGRSFHLLFHRYSDAEHKMEFNSSARADGLLRRVLTKSDMTEMFEGRFDYLHYRRISFSIPDGLSDVQHIPLKKVEERFHRNPNLPLSDDVAKRVFLMDERKIQLTYHMEYFAAIPSKRVLIKPLPATESRRAEDFTSANIQTLQVDPSVKPPSRIVLYLVLQDLVKGEIAAAEHAKVSRNEFRDILQSREEEEKNLQLIFSPWTYAGAALAHKHQKQKLKTAEQQDWQLEHVDDYLVPHLVNLEFPETLSATDVENLVAKCVQEFKENRKGVANFLKEHHKKLLQELREKQRWYQQNQGLLNKEEVEKFHDYCSDKTLVMKVVQRRLDRYVEETSQKVAAFREQLLKSPWLSLQTLS